MPTTTDTQTIPEVVTLADCMTFAAGILGLMHGWDVEVEEDFIDAYWRGTTHDHVEVGAWGPSGVMVTRVVESPTGQPIRDEAHDFPLTREGFVAFSALVNGWA